MINQPMKMMHISCAICCGGTFISSVLPASYSTLLILSRAKALDDAEVKTRGGAAQTEAQVYCDTK